MTAHTKPFHVYEGPGDDLMEQVDVGNRIILLPDMPPAQRGPDQCPRIRIMWGQRLIDDLLAGRYRTLVCAVNAKDNSHGFINLLAQQLATSQWREEIITSHAKHFVQPHAVRIVKFDMDRVEVLGILRPGKHEHMTLDDLATGFQMICAMLQCRPERSPVASVCFVGARANQLVDHEGKEPSFETVLNLMYRQGYRGDVYPAPWMWEHAPVGVFPRYPFPEMLREMCEGGF
jgi:hypothetical protein